MPEEQQRFAKAVNRMMDAIIFENWLRFYFLAEDESVEEGQEEAKLRISIPEKAMAQISQRYGALKDMAEALNGSEATLENSRSAVVNFVRHEVEGSLVPTGGLAACFDSMLFQNSLHLFNAWIQAAEEMLDKTFYDFDQWRDLFASYKDSPSGQKIMAQMEEDAKKSAESDKN